MANFDLSGLRAPASIHVDRWGLPHIRAQSVHDAFFTQGFNAARDRLWQIDLWRKRGLGRLAADFGPGYLMQDRAARLFLYRGPMEAEWSAYCEDTQETCTAFANGINAAIDEVIAGRMPLPEEFDRMSTAPEHWAPEDVVRIRTHCLVRNAASELARAKVLARADAETDLLRAPLNPSVDPAEWQLNAGSDLPADALAVLDLAMAPVSFSPERLAASLEDAPRWSQVNAAKTVIRSIAIEGSNNWVISGRHTASGRPIMASDPHRAHAAPSLRYMVHMTAPGLDIIGAGEPSSPGIMAGHNGHAAFSLTIFCADQEDVMVYDTDPDRPDHYRYQDRWEEMRSETESFEVRGHPDQVLDLSFTRHGPVVWRDANRAVAVRTVFSEPGTAPYLASLATMRARSFDQFKQDATRWGAPTVNLVYADTDGDFGWQAAGFVPRRTGWRGLVPAAGDGRFEWQGFITAADLPCLDAPEAGFVCSANEMNLPEEWPADVTVGHEWFEDLRAARIAEALAAGSGGHDVASSCALQTDTFSPFAPRLIALLPDDVTGADILRDWDGRSQAQSAPALLFELWLSSHLRPALLKRIAPDDALRRYLVPGNIPVITALLEGQHPKLTDRAGLSTQADREAFLSDTLRRAHEEAKARFGPAENWAWGQLHQGYFDHALPELSLGPWPKGGSSTSIMLAHYEASDYRVRVGASVRMVIDVGAWDNSVWINAPGQSGLQGTSHLDDLAPLWAEGQYVPLAYSQIAVDAVTEEIITLSPA
ncbi:penicillin acylase family protein [Lutimaribacter marinistellae]|uniref:Penicillin acylase family protein n=1 Tax=Lutimaribacter marinistellae TaxID=1820329 RepID=A0ABV7TJ76_9RHOB